MRGNFKIGDLVKWTYPDHEDHGIVVAINERVDGYVSIAWCLRPEHNGPYPMGNTYLEKVS